MKQEKTILLGVTASISIYKACDLTRELAKAGVRIRVAMSQTAQSWISPTLFEALGAEKVYLAHQQGGMPHIEIRENLDLLLVAPATAHFIAKAAHGFADDILTQTLLSYSGPRWIAPAMNPYMYNHPATQKNLQTLQEYGYRILPVQKGEAVCGDVGEGKLMDITLLYKEILDFLS